MSKTFKNCFIFILSAIMAFSALCAFELLAPAGMLTAYAAGISAPKPTAANATPTSVELKWKKVKSADKYIVSRSTSKKKGYKTIKTVKASTLKFTDKKLTTGKTYYYKVTAVKGNQKKASSPVKIKATPAGVKKLDGESKSCGYVTLSIKKVSGATGYEICYSPTEKGTYNVAATQKSTEFTHYIGEGITGYYKTRAYKTVKGKKVYGAYSYILAVETYAHNYTASVTAPTCLADGYTTYTCAMCGNAYKTDITLKTGHTFGSYVVDISASCGTSGSKHRECTGCGIKEYAVIDPTGEHSYGEYAVVTAPTCLAGGVGASECKYCGKVKTKNLSALGHSYTSTRVEADCTNDGYTLHSCIRCDEQFTDSYTAATGHSFTENPTRVGETQTHTLECALCGLTGEAVDCEFSSSITKPPTKQEDGVMTYTCICGNSYTDSIDKVSCDHEANDFRAENYQAPTCTQAGCSGDIFCNECDNQIASSHELLPLGHDISTAQDENGYLVSSCSRCDYTDVDTTCYINLDDKTVSVPAAAEFTVSAAGNNKLELNYDGVSNYEITGTAENLSIDVNAVSDCEVKLAGVTITNTNLDIINTKDKSPDESADGSGVADEIPIVSVSAKVDTVNTLKTLESGNAIDGACKLSLKGRGKIIMNTASTAISNTAKIFIKNLTLDITSANRGIDTKKDILIGTTPDTEFFNIELDANANITINSTDDGIRCKNFDSNWLGAGDVDSVLTITAGALADGIQLEGKSSNRDASMILHSGILNISGGKNIINNKSMKTPIANGTAQTNFVTIPAVSE